MEEQVTREIEAGGRRLGLRRPSALDKLRLIEAAGAKLAENDRWLGMAVLAAAVAEIDGVPYPLPASKAAIEAMVGRLGDDGIAAVAAAIAPDEEVDRPLAGN